MAKKLYIVRENFNRLKHCKECTRFEGDSHSIKDQGEGGLPWTIYWRFRSDDWGSLDQQTFYGLESWSQQHLFSHHDVNRNNRSIMSSHEDTFPWCRRMSWCLAVAGHTCKELSGSGLGLCIVAGIVVSIKRFKSYKSVTLLLWLSMFSKNRDYRREEARRSRTRKVHSLPMFTKTWFERQRRRSTGILR